MTKYLAVDAFRNNYRLNFIINSFIFVTKWKVTRHGTPRCAVLSPTRLSVDDIFSFTSLSFRMDADDGTDDTFTCASNCAPKITCRLPNNTTVTFLIFRFVLLCVSFSTLRRAALHTVKEATSKNHATTYSFRIKSHHSLELQSFDSHFFWLRHGAQPLMCGSNHRLSSMILTDCRINRYL